MKNEQPPLRLVIDGNEANVQHRVGSNVYAFEMIKALEKIMAASEGRLTAEVILAEEKKHQEWPVERAGWHYRVIGPARAWTQWAEPVFLAKYARRNFDVLYTPGHYAPRVCPIPYVSSVMDLAFLEYPEQFRPKDLWQLTNWTAYSVQRAARVVAISEFTASEVERHYGKPRTEIVVAPPGLGGEGAGGRKLKKTRADALLQEAGIKGRFYLYVGTIQPRKNLVSLIAAFDEALLELGAAAPDDLQLVLAGKIGWLAEETLARVAASPHQDRIVLTGFVSDELKAALLQRCLGNFNLGLYEGFGIPALEALAAGAIPVVANNTSLPEVVGDAGLLVAPDDLPKIAQAMRRLLQVRPFEREVFLQQAKKQLAKYSYAHSATTVLAALAEVAEVAQR